MPTNHRPDPIKTQCQVDLFDLNRCLGPDFFCLFVCSFKIVPNLDSLRKRKQQLTALH